MEKPHREKGPRGENPIGKRGSGRTAQPHGTPGPSAPWVTGGQQPGGFRAPHSPMGLWGFSSWDETPKVTGGGKRGRKGFGGGGVIAVGWGGIYWGAGCGVLGAPLWGLGWHVWGPQWNTGVLGALYGIPGVPYGVLGVIWGAQSWIWGTGHYMGRSELDVGCWVFYGAPLWGAPPEFSVLLWGSGRCLGLGAAWGVWAVLCGVSPPPPPPFSLWPPHPHCPHCRPTMSPHPP